jgi:hypothetical protein
MNSPEAPERSFLNRLNLGSPERGIHLGVSHHPFSKLEKTNFYLGPQGQRICINDMMVPWAAE